MAANSKGVRGFVQRAGGYMAVAVACEVSESAVRRWVWADSIPEAYWAFFIKNAEATTDALHAINERSRKSGRAL